jgi:hypothetical protein
MGEFLWVVVENRMALEKAKEERCKRWKKEVQKGEKHGK